MLYLAGNMQMLQHGSAGSNAGIDPAMLAQSGIDPGPLVAQLGLDPATLAQSGLMPALGVLQVPIESEGMLDQSQTVLGPPSGEPVETGDIEIKVGFLYGKISLYTMSYHSKYMFNLLHTGYRLL